MEFLTPFRHGGELASTAGPACWSALPPACTPSTWPLAARPPPLDRPEALIKLDSYDRHVALATLRRDFDPDGPLFGPTTSTLPPTPTGPRHLPSMTGRQPRSPSCHVRHHSPPRPR